eukprot:gene27235-biopygen17766
MGFVTATTRGIPAPAAQDHPDAMQTPASEK